MGKSRQVPPEDKYKFLHGEVLEDLKDLTIKYDALKAKYDVVYAALEHDVKVKKQMLEVLRELQECSEYWSEYFVPIGIHQRIANAIKAGEEL